MHGADSEPLMVSYLFHCLYKTFYLQYADFYLVGLKMFLYKEFL